MLTVTGTSDAHPKYIAFPLPKALCNTLHHLWLLKGMCVRRSACVILLYYAWYCSYLTVTCTTVCILSSTVASRSSVDLLMVYICKRRLKLTLSILLIPHQLLPYYMVNHLTVAESLKIRTYIKNDWPYPVIN